MRVLLVDDDPAILRGLALLLGPEPDLEVVGVARDGAEAVEKAASLRPDVVLMDRRMPRLDGLEATRAIRRLDPRVRIVVLSVYAERVEEALAAGAERFLLKDCPIEDLLDAVRGRRVNEALCQAGPQTDGGH